MARRKKILIRRSQDKYDKSFFDSSINGENNKLNNIQLKETGVNDETPLRESDSVQHHPPKSRTPKSAYARQDKHSDRTKDETDLALKRDCRNDYEINNENGSQEVWIRESESKHGGHGENGDELGLVRSASGVVRNSSYKSKDKKSHYKDAEDKNLLNEKNKIQKDTTDLDRDQTDTEFTCFDVFIYLFSICTYLADVGSDIFLAFLYFKDKHWAWFSFTVVFIVLPAFINTCFSLVWYLQDKKYYKEGGISISACRWIVRTLFLIFQIGPVLRYLDVLIYGCKSRRKCEKSKYYLDLMLNEDSDAALLRLLECFMEAAPQLVLQLYIICKYGPEESLLLKLVQIAACLSSLASLAWALTSYHRSLRLSLPNKAKIGYIGMGLQFVWRFFTVGARVIALALFASVYGFWVFVFCGCHWFVMLVWILLLRTHFCNGKCQEVFFNMVIAIVHVFCFINVLEGHTRLRYFFFYTIVYLENVALIFGWYIFAHTEDIWYLGPALGTVLGGFFLGPFFQIIYYLFFHPNNNPENSRKRIQLWVPLKILCTLRSTDENMNERMPMKNVHTDGQKRMLEISKHHSHHIHSSIV